MKNDKLAGIRMLLVLISGLVIWNCSGNSITAAETPGSELVLNGTMEKGNPPADWTTDAGGATLSADTDSHSGKQSMRISPLAGNSEHRATQNFTIKANTKYRYEFWYKSTTDVAGLYFYLAVGKVYPAGYYTATGSAETWTRLTGEFETSGFELRPDKTAQLGFCGYIGGDILIDDVSVIELNSGAVVAPVVKEAPVVVAPAATETTTDAARAKARQDWLYLFPGRKYICWDKSPWDKLAKVQLPPTTERPGYEFPFQECKEINLVMGGNEYESTSFVLTNLSDKTVEFAVSVKDAGIPITIRQAFWVTTYTGKEVNDALPLLEGNLSIPSGESREVWLTLYTKGVKARDYNSQITITSQGLSSLVNLKTKVYSVSLPDDKPIYTHYWDMMDTGEKHDPEFTRGLVADKKAHDVTLAEVAHWTIPFQLNPDGTLKEDYQALDKLIEYWQETQPNPKMFFISCSVLWWGGFPGKPLLSAEWNTLFASHLTKLVSHLKEKGVGYDRFMIHIWDEVLDERVYELAKLIKETDPKILTFVNSTASTDLMEKISPYVDIFMPHLSNFISQPKDARDMAIKLLPKSQKFFWTYANPVPPFPQLVSPYSAYRLAVWQAWSEGMGGFGYWIYGYELNWNSANKLQGEHWSVIYYANAKDAPPGLSQKESVVTGKRWEATREGVEDYVYLYMLKDAISKVGRGVSPESLVQAKKVLAESPKTVLGDLKNTTLADKAKEDILKAISKISPAKNR